MYTHVERSAAPGAAQCVTPDTLHATLRPWVLRALAAFVVPRGWPAPRRGDTTTRSGELIRLVIERGAVVGAVAIACPNPWVLRRRYLTPDDVD